MSNEWIKAGSVRSDSGLVWLCDPHKILHSNHAAHAELGWNYKTFVDFMEMKEQATGQKGAVSFNDNDGKNIGMAVQANPFKQSYDLWVKRDSDGNIAEMRVIFDDSTPK